MKKKNAIQVLHNVHHNYVRKRKALCFHHCVKRLYCKHKRNYKQLHIIIFFLLLSRELFLQFLKQNLYTCVSVSVLKCEQRVQSVCFLLLVVILCGTFKSSFPLKPICRFSSFFFIRFLFRFQFFFSLILFQFYVHDCS